MAFDFLLPETFLAGEFLRSPKLRHCHDDARYFVSMIMTKMARGDVDQRGNVRLMAKHLRKIMHSHNYNAVVDALWERGAVDRTPYLIGERAYGYTLSDRFRTDKHVRVPVTNPRLMGRLESFHKQAEQDRRARMKPVHFALERHQYRLGIDGNLAREILAELPAASNPFDVQGVLVADIEQRNFHINVGRYGRMTNNITSMKRELRAALRLFRQPLSYVDISCAQPALIGKAAREGVGTGQQADRGQTGDTRGASIYDAPNTTPLKSELDVYCELVQSGRFYDFMLARLRIGKPSFTRDELKRRFLADVVAKRKANRHGAEYPSEVEDVFREMFPSVYQFIRQINRDGWQHENLIRQLQRAESKLVIETVAADLVVRRPKLFLLTLHDAIFTTSRGIPIVVGSFESAFDETGFPMTLKVAAENHQAKHGTLRTPKLKERTKQ